MCIYLNKVLMNYNELKLNNMIIFIKSSDEKYKMNMK